MAARRTGSHRFLLGAFPLLALPLGGLLSAGPVAASPVPTTISILAGDTGWYSDNDQYFPHEVDNTDYMVGYIDLLANEDANGDGQIDEIDVIFRDFFVFDLPTAPPGLALQSATIRTRNWEVNPGSPTSYVQTVSIYGVMDTISNLVTGNSSIDKLGQGPTYGDAVFYGSEDPEASTSYALNAAALQLLSDSLGNQIAFSGRSNKEVGGGTQGVYVYGMSQNNANYPSVYLDLTFDSKKAPVPAPLPLLGAGAAWRWSRRLRAQNRMRGSSSATSRSTTTVTSTTSAATTTTMPCTSG